ncbi:hypothetical protein JNB_14128 [Janibacter sp. HTCC2649]|uniref:helix-turn-helix domain-containing protein n=1 Tax=Janibacter sp. HTCC2649 TaxID=313589 RepID=UPI00006719EF|nr:helix-turn-helix domain-containing protein [Janibacter sp. HTCC2649]EAP98108.1 hypothetical protein JNB_14128 [Janibacter sp. HTCC2649]
MKYVGRVPAPPLDRYIDDLYCMDGVPQHRRMDVPPLPSAHLIANLGEPVRLFDSLPGVEPTVITDGCFMGVWTRRFRIEFPSPVRVVGVHFKPWGMAPFIDVPSSDLRDLCVPADAVWGSAWSGVHERLAAAASTEELLDVLDGELRSRLAETPSRGLDLVHHTASRLETSWGDVSVSDLTGDAGVSGNHLATQFTSHVGVTPKRVARIYRFARLILNLDATQPVDWAGLAHEAGYFDQAHLSKEFKDFTGYTPTGYLELRRRFPAEQGFPPDSGPMPAK